jgi:sodium transport system permease protein
LVTPATRGQIVLGKLLTTMAFSFTSGMVNLLGTVTTGTFVAGQLAALAGSAGAPSFGPPPLAALGWLVIGAIPISALFSAVSVAVATFARSTKEGQHYLMPVLMICFPLLALPILPGLQLDLGMSLLPVSGLLFWLRALIEGQYSLAARYTIPVLFVNGWCVYLAIYWAIVQFNQESVLFRPVERFSLLAWVRSLLQRQAPLPSLGQVILLVALMFTLKLSLQWITPPPDNWTHFAWHTLLILIGAVALPAILLALTSTQSYTATLHLLPTSTKHLLSAVGLAVCFHPLILTFQQLVMNLYPLQMDTTPWQDSFSNLFSGAPGLWAILLLMAMAPAVCEELAFRGYILSGLRRWTTNLNAVLLTAILFGATHGLLQQSIVATATGIVLGFVAIRTGSLWPCIAYHAVHNALTLQFVFLDQEKIAQSRLYGFLLETQLNEQGQLIDLNYAGLPAAAMIISGIWICLNLAPSTDAPDATHLKALHPAAGPSVSA